MSDANSVFDPAMYSFHQVADGISLDDFVITPDMPTCRGVPGHRVLTTLEIPPMLEGKPVVELSVDFHREPQPDHAGRIKYLPLADTLILPHTLKRICCPLNGRGIHHVTLSPENPHLIFDDFAWYEDGGETLGGTWSGPSMFPLPGSLNEYTIRDGAIRASSIVPQEYFLEKLTFPDSFIQFPEGFLLNRFRCSTVKKIYGSYDSCMREYAAVIKAEFIALDRIEVVFSPDGGQLLSCPQLFAQPVYTVPDTVRRIAKEAFKGNEGIQELQIPDTVEVIEEGAFSQCAALERVTLPSHLKELPKGLFADCPRLTQVTLPAGLESIGDKCFLNTALENPILPATLRKLGSYAFGATEYKKNAIKAIEIPASVQELGISVCAGIPDITVYDSIEPTKKPASDHYDDINGGWNSRVGCIGIWQRESCVWAACNCKCNRHTITVKSAADGSVKYKVLMYGDEEPRNVYCGVVSSWGKNAEFRFEKLDEKFSKLKVVENRIETVKNRLLYPIALSEEAKAKYVSWLKRNAVTVIGSCIDSDDLTGLMAFATLGAVTKKNILELIDLATAKGNPELTAYLLTLQATL